MKILFYFLLSIILSGYTYAGCNYPYVAEVDYVEPNYDCLHVRDSGEYCGGSIVITNYCKDVFYIYDNNGELNKGQLMINFEEYSKNFKEYSGQEKVIGSYFSKVPQCNKLFSQDRHPCHDLDESTLKDGEIVKTWSIKLYSNKNNEDIIIGGRTVYDKGTNINPREVGAAVIKNLSYIGFFLVFPILFLKLFIKKRIHWFIILAVILFSIFLYFFSEIFRNLLCC